MNRKREENQNAGGPSILITAGPTHEPIDAVRFLGNRSSGKLGIALAHAALDRTLRTTLLLGPAEIDPSALYPQCTLLRFQTCAELQILLREQWPGHDILIMAAAVADFRPVDPVESGKMRRSGHRITLELEPTPDLLAGLADSTRTDQLVIAFALEPAKEMIDSARDKMQRKRVHAVVANPIETVASDEISAVVVTGKGLLWPRPDGRPVSKRAFADWLLDFAISEHPAFRALG